MIIKPTLHRGRSLAAIVLAGALAGAGCSLEEQTAPDITGPSTFSQSFLVTLSADTIQRDGSAQSTINILARNSDGTAAANQRIRVSATAPAGTTLSANEVVTDPSGRGTVTVTAPPSTSVGNQVTVGLVPVDVNGVPTQVGQNVLIGITPSNASAPVAGFTFTPASPGLNEPVTFNASTSTDEGGACGTCSFAWDFGDGSTATGVVVTRAFTTSGTRAVRLTVTDAGGATSTPVTQSLTVSTGTITAAITVSPTNPRVGDEVRFDGRGSTLSGGATVTSYEWDFGNGQTAAGATATTTYNAARSYTVRLTITDSLGRTATTTTTVTVAAATP